MLIWQHPGIELRLVIGVAVIILLAVGADWRLLLVARLRRRSTPESAASSVRWVAGQLVTAAGLVLPSDVVCRPDQMMAQVGTTIGMGLLLRHPDRPGRS